ncbi:MAG: cobyrinate a,c-diamide synthase [Alphaproteobacteria bacterium]|nr:cobyrinate a,c-diamide synthase [Alphaproteobacteria bacterium]
MTTGLLIAAPSSGSGKTVITLALLRALRRAGHAVSSLKIGPDYIDPGFHTLASGRPCLNIDGWAMRPTTRAGQLDQIMEDVEFVVAEGVMGLFDGAADGTGSSADLAVELDFPVILIVDVSGQSASAAAVINGFKDFRDDIDVVGVIFNRVGSPRHQQMLHRAMAAIPVPVLGYVPRNDALKLDSRHLGLVQAEEVVDIENQIDAAASFIENHIDVGALTSLGNPLRTSTGTSTTPIPPLGQRVAVASDAAFSFCYPHVLKGWQEAGATISIFSPLADQTPPNDCDAIYLPGGYPELHAEQISSNGNFMSGLRHSADQGATLYGECGGYMVLGTSLTDRDSNTHPMAGLLPIETSFATPKLHLGYRKLQLKADGPLGKSGTVYRGHEFHYSTQRMTSDEFLFAARDALDEDLGSFGCQNGTVLGSYIHLIDSMG